MEEFLKAEMVTMSRGNYKTITIEDILQHRSPEDLIGLAMEIQREVVPRFATRVRQIEETTPLWRDIPELVELHTTIFTSFKRLRLVEFDEYDLGPFTKVVEDIAARHLRPLVPNVAKAARALQERGILSNAELQEWMWKFVNSRKGTNILLHHYQALLEDPNVDHIGIVDMSCCPEKVCRSAIEEVKAQRPDVDIQLKVANEKDLALPFIPQILHNVVAEVLRNGVRAVESKKSKKTLEVLLTASPKQVAIQISDLGGGIYYKHTDRIWEYLFSTDEQGSDLLQVEEDWASVSYTGMGLPLCRNYVEYLGGSFSLMSVPGIGTDAYIYLNRIDAGRIDSLRDL